MLSLVPTPIGHLEDITLRALKVLQQADRILAEDTRRTRQLCAHHGIDTPLTALHAHSSEAQIEAVVRTLVQGTHCALVSDAGMPLISDPGLSLVQRARAAGVTVTALPGPSAVTCAVALAALSPPSFTFHGFVPRSGGKRSERLAEIADSRHCSVLFEAPQRLPSLLADLAPLLGPARPVVLCRELSKAYEEVRQEDAAALLATLTLPVRGECTLVVAGQTAPKAVDMATASAMSLCRALTDLPPQLGLRAAAQTLAAAHQLPRKSVYQALLQVQRLGRAPG